MAELQVLMISNWALAYGHNPRAAIFRFDFTDRQPIVLAMGPDAAVAMAKAILEQEKNPPPKPNRLS